MNARAERRLASGVWQRALPSETLPPFDATWSGLITYGGRGLLIDPGFRDPADADALLAWAAARGATDVDRVALTHTHPDHVAGLPALLARLGDVPVHVHPAEADRLPAGVRAVPTGDARVLPLAGRRVRALHTPGHAPGHLAFAVETDRADEADANDALLIGDLLTGRGGAWVGTPYGDVDAYLASLARIRAQGPRILGPAHGDAIDDPAAALDAAAAHRRDRLEAIVRTLAQPMTLDALQASLYGEVPPDADRFVRGAVLASLASLLRARRIAHVGEGEAGPYVAMPGA